MVDVYAPRWRDMRGEALYKQGEIGYNGIIRHPAAAESESIGRATSGLAEIDIVGYPAGNLNGGFLCVPGSN